jgi:hypothetical protein
MSLSVATPEITLLDSSLLRRREQAQHLVDQMVQLAETTTVDQSPEFLFFLQLLKQQVDRAVTKTTIQPSTYRRFLATTAETHSRIFSISIRHGIDPQHPRGDWEHDQVYYCLWTELPTSADATLHFYYCAYPNPNHPTR